MARLGSLGAITVALILASASAAGAVSPPVTVGTPLSNQPPSVAVDSAGDAIVAWSNNANSGNLVQYCVIATGGNACSHTGSLTPADGPVYIDGVHVLADGGTIVILADVYGTQGTSAADYQPEQEWRSTDGGATLNIVNGGVSVSSASLNGDTGPLNAVIVPGTNVLGFGWDTPGGPPTFNAFPLVSPSECSKAKPCPFAELQPSSAQQVGNTGGEYASEAGSQPGVLGVFPDQFSNGPLGCSANGMLFAYGAGNQSASNSYNVSPGSPGSAWTGPVAVGQCGVQFLAVGGGPSGFGVVETDETQGRTVYQPFNSATKTFGAMTTLANKGEQQPSLSQDGTGGIYATYEYDAPGGPIALSYSGDGGKTWSGPAQLDAFNGENDISSAVNGAGQGWVTWVNNGSVFAQPFTAADAAGPPIVSGAGSSNGQTITVTVTCTAFPCTVTITILGPPKVAADIARKHKPTVLAKRRFKITKAGAKKLTMRLTKAGKRFFKSRHGKVRVKAHVAMTFKGHTKSTSRTIRVKIVKHHKKK